MAGLVYISRDVIFDEQLFPFASMHPNAGAQLRAEIALLPNMLQNPSASRDAFTPDNAAVSPSPTNPSQSSAGDLMHAGENLEKFGSKTVNSGRPVLCRSPGDSANTEGDSPGAVVVPVAESASGSEAISTVLPPAAEAGLSAAGSFNPVT
jgi:hypothetical protein